MSEQARLARVERLLAAARRAADPGDALGLEVRRQLAALSGLSAAGIALALEQHLESRPSAAELAQLVSSARPATRCHLVLAANVCTAALRALGCAVASAPRVSVRPSRRDPVLAETLVGELASDERFEAAGGVVELVGSIAARPGDVVHAYGSDEALAALASSLPDGVELLRHGTGIGVAVVGADDPLDRAAAAIARDVVPFDQRGCLSPRFVLCEGSARRVEQLGATLHEALAAAGERVPRGPLEPALLAEIAVFRELARALGPLWQGEHHLVALDPTPTALWLAPAARIVPVAPCEQAEVGALLGPWARFVTAVGMGVEATAPPCPAGAAVLALCPSARRSLLGRMQRPPFDGPVDLRAASPR